MNPQAPILYGLSKLHKIDHPVRPVVFYINAPAYKICKYLNNLLQGIFTSKFSIKNSLELTQALQHLNIQNSYKLVSFDVKNLFLSIPLSDLKIILEKLINSNIIDPSRNNHIRQLLDLCLNQNYFIFNNKYYKTRRFTNG